MARSYGTGPPSPERGSRHSVTVGHAEPGHRVENPAGESHLHALPYQRATRHGSADDRLVPIDRVLDHGAPAVACSLGPLAAAEFVDRADVPVPLLQRSRRSWTQLGVASRWNAHSDGSPVTLCVSRLVDALGVVRAVCRNRGHALVDLTKQGGSLRAIAHSDETSELRRRSHPCGHRRRRAASATPGASVAYGDGPRESGAPYCRSARGRVDRPRPCRTESHRASECAERASCDPEREDPHGVYRPVTAGSLQSDGAVDERPCGSSAPSRSRYSRRRVAPRVRHWMEHARF